MKNKLLKVIVTTALALTGAVILSGSKDVKAADHSIQWKLNTGTALHETDGNWEFLVDDYNHDGQNDLFAICKSGSTGSKHAEIHVLNGADNFKSFLLHQALPFTLDENWTFQLGNYNKDGVKDLYCVLKSANSARNTELHILDGKSNYQTFLLQKTIPLKVTNKDWYFRAADGEADGSDDLYCIQRANTGSKKVEVHALSASSEFQGFFIHSATAWKCCGSEWDFQVKRYNSDKVPDLYGINKNDANQTKTLIHILDGANNFSESLFRKATPLEKISKNNFQFCLGNGALNIYAIKKSATGTKSTEVHLFGFPNSNPSFCKPSPTSVVDPVTAQRQAVINEAKNHLGQPYVWGAAGPSSFDCSGFTMYVYKTVLGINLPHHAADQAKLGTEVSRNNLLPGDLIFFNNDGHVGIYLGDNQFIHASGTQTKPLYVKISSLSENYYNTHYGHARRFIN